MNERLIVSVLKTLAKNNELWETFNLAAEIDNAASIKEAVNRLFDRYSRVSLVSLTEASEIVHTRFRVLGRV